MRNRVVLHPGPRYAQGRGESWWPDERRAARVERQHGFPIERQPLAVAPERPGTRRDRLPRGGYARGIEDRVERAEALFAHRDRGWLVQRSAGAAHLRPWPQSQGRRNAGRHGRTSTAGAAPDRG